MKAPRPLRPLAEPWQGAGWDAALAVPLLLSCLVVPLVFSTANADVFALPKALAARFLMAAVLGVLAARIFTGRRLGLPAEPALGWVLAVFVAANLVAYGLSIDRTQSLFGESLQHQGLLTIGTYVGFGLIASAVIDGHRRLEQILATVVLAGIGVVSYALIQRAGLDPIWDEPLGKRVFSSIGQPNALAAYLVIVIPIAAVTARTASHRWFRVVAAGCAIGGVLALSFTRSRGGYLGITAAAVVLAVLWHRNRKDRSRPDWRRRARIGAIALGVIALSVPLTRLAVTDVWTRVTNTGVEQGSVRDHISLWKVGVEIAADHPFVGTGQETYPLVFGEYRDEVLDPEAAEALSPFRPESPHNQYVGIAAGTGFPALAAYLAAVALLGLILARGMNAAPDARTRAFLIGIAAAGAGHLVTDFFMTPETTGSLTFWVLAGAAVGTVSAQTAGDPAHQDA